MIESKTELGRFIRTYRLYRGMRQKELAEKTEIPQQEISKIETGGRKALDQRKKDAIARVLGCKIDELEKRMPKPKELRGKNALSRFIIKRMKELDISLEELKKVLGKKNRGVLVKSLDECKKNILHYKTAKLIAKTLRLEISAFEKFLGTTGIQKSPTTKLGAFVRQARKRKGMSQKTLAKKIRVTHQYISQIELGEINFTRSKKGFVRNLARTLGVMSSYLKSI